MLIPDHETAVDLLNYEAISKTVVAVLKSQRAAPLTVGVHGNWGAGKSSVLRMVEFDLAKDKDVVCLRFEGWTFQGFDDAKTVLIETVIDEVRRKRSGNAKVKEVAGALLKRLDILKISKRLTGLAVTALTGVPVAGLGTVISNIIETAIGNLKTGDTASVTAALEGVAGYLKPPPAENLPEVMHHFRRDFEQLLGEAKIEQLVVLIDDLDRCLPATAIDTLEAIRLFLFVPKTAFVIAADEAMIEYAVRQHFPELPASSGPGTYARNYLEKLIQVPFRIPALGSQETRTYLTLSLIQSCLGDEHQGFKKFLIGAKQQLRRPWKTGGLKQSEVEAIDATSTDDLRAAYLLGEQIGPILAEGTRGNPRQIKRFLNTLLLRRAIAKEMEFDKEVSQPALAKLMLAERFAPDFYETVASLAMQDANGRVSDLSWLEKSPDVTPAGSKEPKGRKGGGLKPEQEGRPEHVERWMDQTWLVTWGRIAPALAGLDLRPYVFVARDKRVALVAGTGLGAIDTLVMRLLDPPMKARMAERDVQALSPELALQAFNMVRERVLSADWTTEPYGLEGLRLIAKHHGDLQLELVRLVGGIEPGQLGIWVVKGWGEAVTRSDARGELKIVFRAWAKQDDNAALKRAAEKTMTAVGG